MPKSFRIKTEIGVNKVIPVNLEQQFDTLEILSLAIFPNDIYTRSCADFGVLCGRVFANRGFGIPNARVSVFIPLQEIDEKNPVISTLYPYKRIEDFNEDGYKYNLLPYTQSHSGHVPVGSFPDRLDALTNQSVIEVYDKYYKYTTKTNESGDYMIFGLPIGQHSIFMQVDLSDIGEFSLTPQDLIRMGIATETQIDGVKFKFSENYSELPQIVTLQRSVQVAPFYGEQDVCDHYIVRSDFDLTSEAGVELRPTAVFIGSIISHNNRKKIKKRCQVPSKAGWLCDLITGPGQIEAIRQTIFKDNDGRPILEEFTLENSGKVIDENGTWVLEVPMNLDYVYTNEDGKKVLSDNPDLGVPTKGKYRFKIKWNQSPKVGDENKRGYFLVPNSKEWGWEESDSENIGTPTNTDWSLTQPTSYIADQTITHSPPFSPYNPREIFLNPNWFGPYYAVSLQSFVNVDTLKFLFKNPDTDVYEEKDIYGNYIPTDGSIYSFTDIKVVYTPIDPESESYFTFRLLREWQFKQETSYTFSVNWGDYGTQEMITEAISCEDRFYQMSYNKVYTVSQLIDRFAWQTFPQKAVEIKHITENKCEGDYNPFPANDVYYRYDIIFLILSFAMNFIVQPILIAVIIIFHVLAWLFKIFQNFYPAICGFKNRIIRFKCWLHGLSIGPWEPFDWVTCEDEQDCSLVPENPFLNMRLGVFLYTDDGCERCKCNIAPLTIPDSDISYELANFNNSFGNTSITPDFTSVYIYDYPNLSTFNSASVDYPYSDYYKFIPLIAAGGSGNLFEFQMAEEQKPFTFLLPIVSEPLYEGKVLQFSPSLTLGERLNLFNTKAKYFDSGNVTYRTFSGHSTLFNTFFNGSNNDFDETNDAYTSNTFTDIGTPGRVGWSQIKVTWWPELNNELVYNDITDVSNSLPALEGLKYTLEYNNQNSWVIYGNKLGLFGQSLILYNAADTNPAVDGLGTNGLEVIVTSAVLQPAIINPFTNEPISQDSTIIEFSCGTTNNLTSITEIKDTVNISQNECKTVAYAGIGLIWKIVPITYQTFIPNESGFGGQTVYENTDFTAMVGSTIYLYKYGTNLLPTYYEESAPNVPIQLVEGTPVKILSIETYNTVNDGIVYGATFQLQNGQIIYPNSSGKKFKYKKTNGIKYLLTPNTAEYQPGQFQPILNYNTFHLDNVIILLVENNSIKTGDLLTFQNPELSQDPNVNKPVGMIDELNQGSITVEFANPLKNTYSLNNGGGGTTLNDEFVDGGNLKVTYVAPVYERERWVSPHPRDVEYFQAITVIPWSAMTTNRQTLFTKGSNRFSLPWRYLDSSNGRSIEMVQKEQTFSFGCYAQPPGTTLAQFENFVDSIDNSTIIPYSYWLQGVGSTLQTSTKITLDNSSDSGVLLNYVAQNKFHGLGDSYQNDFRIYRYQYQNLFNDPDGNFPGLGGYNDLFERQVVQYSPFTRAFQLVTPVDCSQSSDELIGGTTDIWSTLNTSRYKIVVLQRGVDPHSPKINVRYDLSRLYGYADYGVNNNQFVVEGEYRMNVPIQGRKNSPLQNPDDLDMTGYKLPRHTLFNSNGSIIEGMRLFYPSYIYKDSVDSYSGNWETNLHTYYSAFDSGAVENYNVWTAGLTYPVSYVSSVIVNPGETPEWGITSNDYNLFNNNFTYVPQSYEITEQGAYLDNLGQNRNGQFFTGNCQPMVVCSDNTTFGPNGIGLKWNHFADIPAQRMFTNVNLNNASGYWGNEYVEGASLMVAKKGSSFSRPGGLIGGLKYYYAYQLNSSPPGPVQYSTSARGSCNDCNFDETNRIFSSFTEIPNNNDVFLGLNVFEYYSPTYRTVPNDVNAAATWASSAHTIQMASSTYNVFRSDRLPTSTSVTQYGNNGFLMHQNPTFAVFIINADGVSAQQGGYDLPDQAQTSEIDLNELPEQNQAIIDSLVNCEYAVNLNSYDVDADGNPYIKNNDPFSIKLQGGSVYHTYFVRGMGCYNFVSEPFKSLFGVPDRNNGGGGDIASAVEWTRRTVLNFSLCFEIYSHTFSNNWINGVLYHFPFQLNTIFGSDNEPIRDYCKHVIYFHEPNQTFYYRSSPYNGSDFIGKTNPGRMLGVRYGNDKQLMYPTTILDMGPKTNYLQELVFSDEYDGYIISKIPTSTFQNVTNLLNIFVLSRLVNTNFLQQLIPTNSSGNNEGADDPSVTGFFSNTRWANGDSFFNNLLPSVVDADYSQMLSINSEFGVKEYGPEVYKNTDIWFINDNNGNSVFGITLKSDNQERDYISPRRTIWNNDSSVPPPPGNFTQIPVATQKVPSYQWVIRYQYDNTANDPLQYTSIFGMQSNDFWTNAPGPCANDPIVGAGSSIFTSGFFWSYYQRLDRFNDSSEYFKTDITNVTKFYKAHIINYSAQTDVNGDIVLDDLGNVLEYVETANAPTPSNRRYAYTFGAPFHFYFGLIQGASAMDRFRTKYVDTNIQYE